MTMSAADFLDQWFETDVLKATMSASGIIGTFLGIRSPGTAYVLLHHYMGEIDGAFRSWGFSRGGTGAISNAIGDAAREAGVEIRKEAAVAKILVKNGVANGVVLEGSGEEISRRRHFFQRRSQSHLPEIHRRARTSRRFSRRRPPLQIPRLFRQSESRARWPAGFHLPARPRPSSSRRDFHFAFAWSTWNAPTIRPSTANFRAGPTSIW